MLIDCTFEFSQDAILNAVVQLDSECFCHLVLVLIKEEDVVGTEELVGLEDDAIFAEGKRLVEVFHRDLLRNKRTAELRCVE